MKSKKYILIAVLVAVFFSIKAQYSTRQSVIGGEFSFANSRNSISRSTTDFANSYSNGFNAGIMAGEFITPKTLLYGALNVEYASFIRDLVTDNLTNKTEQDIFSSTFTMQLGVGARRYYAVNEKNVIGLFLQGQIGVGNSWIVQRNFASVNDSVFQDFDQRYPVRILSANINPGVYVNITKSWQLTLNIGNLYYTQTLIPEFANYAGNRNNSSFGLDVNLFDFRLGVLYTPKKE